MKLIKKSKQQGRKAPIILIVMPAGVGASAEGVVERAFGRVDLLSNCEFVRLSPNEKYRKADIEPFRLAILERAKSDESKVLCTVGPEVFKHLLGRGKLPSMKTLQGSVVYERLINYKAVVALPEIATFDLEFPFGEPPFAQRRFKEWVESCAIVFAECVEKAAKVFNEQR